LFAVSTRLHYDRNLGEVQTSTMVSANVSRTHQLSLPCEREGKAQKFSAPQIQ